MIFNKSGQIVVVVLLFSMIGLTLGLSVVSRSLSDYKQVTYVDSGTKAFAAAEAGVSKALADLTAGSPTIDCADHQGPAITGIKDLKYKICPNDSGYVLISLAKDEVLQLDLTGAPENLKTLDVLWKNAGNNAAMEVISVDSANVLTRYVNNANGMTPPSANAFSSAVAGANCLNVGAGDVCNDTSFNTGSCLELVPKAGLIRVKPLYAEAIVLVCGRSAGGSPGRLDGQSYVITVTATTNDDTVKKLQVQKSLPALPAIFDYVLFSKGQIAK